MPAAKLDFSPPQAVDPATLPNGDSPDLELVIASPEELQQCILLDFTSWGGPLSAEAYLRREEHLWATDLSQNGGLSGWILVDRNDQKSPRNILAACESIRKRALVASKTAKEVKDTWAFAIGSVYCREEYRGKGYAVRMMAELRQKLEYWQQKGGLKTEFTVLYSDIGKVCPREMAGLTIDVNQNFYAKNGWIPYASCHISLPAKRDVQQSSRPRMLRAEDVADLCQKDEQILRQALGDFSSQNHDFRLAWIPDAATMQWHHAREEFLSTELLEKIPEVKGALIESENGKSAWCIWNRVFSKNQKENVLYILRIVIEGEDHTGKHIDSEQVKQVAACLSAAQDEAALWGMSSVDMWNPSPTVFAGCREVHPASEIIHRDQESITCMNWYGEQPGAERVEWVANEKFGWC